MVYAKVSLDFLAKKAMKKGSNGVLVTFWQRKKDLGKNLFFFKKIRMELRSE